MADSGLSVRFWGVRGSIACPEPQMLRYGGNTSCVEMRCGEHVLIFDAGTGLKALGDSLAADGDQKINLFLSHTHLDHINGFPFFRPAYGKSNTIKIWAGHLFPDGNIREVLSRMMEQPFFPISVGILAAWMEFVDFRPGAVLEPVPGVKIRTALLNHPNGATGYRVEYAGKSACYVTDTEHAPGKPDQAILGLIEGADLFIYDSTYTDEEYASHVGWGHSTWQEGARLAKAAGVKRFVAFHHEPSHDDDFMDGVARELEATLPGAIVAREGITLTP